MTSDTLINLIFLLSLYQKELHVGSLLSFLFLLGSLSNFCKGKVFIGSKFHTGLQISFLLLPQSI